MKLMRVGIVANENDESIRHFHKAALVIVREAYELRKYGRAAAGSMEQDAGVHRLPDVGGCVVWGKDEEAIAKIAKRNPCAIMLFVLCRRPKKDGLILKAMERIAKTGSDIHIVVHTKKSKTTAWDIGAGRVCTQAKDITRMPQQQNAPRVPRRAGMPIGVPVGRPGKYIPKASE